jgi:hypothetical protein
MRLWQQRDQYMRRGFGHEILERLVGVWDLSAEFDFAGYGPNVTTKGRVASQMVMDGRFLQSRLSCRIMGLPFHQLSFTGFDSVIDKFQTAILTSTNNGIAYLEGDWDPMRETLREFGEISNAMFRSRHDIGMHRTFVRDGFVKVRISVPNMEGKFVEYLTADLKRREGSKS